MFPHEYCNMLLLAAPRTLFLWRALEPKYNFRLSLAFFGLYHVMSRVVKVYGLGLVDSSFPILRILFVVLDGILSVLIWRAMTDSSFSRIAMFFSIETILEVVGLQTGRAAYLFALRTFPILYQPAILKAFLWYTPQPLTMLFQGLLLVGAGQLIARYYRRHFGGVRYQSYAFVAAAQMLSLLTLGYSISYPEYTLNGLGFFFLYLLAYLVADLYLLYTFQSAVQNAEMKQILGILERQQRLQHAQYAAAGEHLQAMRRVRHDYTNTMQTLDTLIRTGEDASVKALLEEAEALLEQGEPPGGEAGTPALPE